MSPTMRRLVRRVLWMAPGLVIAAVSGAVVTWMLIWVISWLDPREVPVLATWTMLDCISKLSGGQPPPVTPVEFGPMAELCYRVIHGQNMLNDFTIRRIKLFQQQYDEVVMLWMMVAITLSGVVLAGLQLFTSYRLASRSGGAHAEGASEITVEQGRLVFKSSVTGLAILIISFAFFLVFVLEIYTIREYDPDKGAKAQVTEAATQAKGRVSEQVAGPQLAGHINGYVVPAPSAAARQAAREPAVAVPETPAAAR